MPGISGTPGWDESVPSEPMVPKQEPWVEVEQSPRDKALANRTELEKQTTVIAGKQWDRYVTTFKPFEEKVMADVDDNKRYNTQVQGAINANIMQKQTSLGDFAGATGKRSGAISDATAVGTEALAQTGARASVEGSNALVAEGNAMMQNIVDLGRGNADFTVSSLGQAASLATQQSISDWNYKFGMEKLDTLKQMDDSSLDSAQYIANQNYLTSLFSSTTGVMGYGAEQGRFGGKP